MNGIRSQKVRLAVPSDSVRQVILVGTAKAEISPGKAGKSGGGLHYHSIPKGTGSIEITIKKQEGERLNEVIFL